jgi:hypothetical protein
MTDASTSGWAAEELGQAKLGDERLTARLVSLCNRFSQAPQSPINQACEDWAETKAAYRFFQNEDVAVADILEPHRRKTAERAKPHRTILALQDTTHLIYTNHPKTKGLGAMSLRRGKNVEKVFSYGLHMHTCLAVTTQGTPLGLLDLNLFIRQPQSAERRRLVNVIPVEEKESYRWMQSLERARNVIGDTQVVTVCDREADMYSLFELGARLKSPVLVRANMNRSINKKSRYAEKNVVRLWAFMHAQPAAGTKTIEIPERKATSHAKARTARTAVLTIKFGSFVVNPPKNTIRCRNRQSPNLAMNAVYAYETDPPENEERVEWMLLTDLLVTDFDEACEKVHWYCLRWRIEMYFKVLKSGFNVEDCRLATADRLIRYLSVMSIVAWRLLMLTLMARTEPELPCTEFLSETEWRVLFRAVDKHSALPQSPPSIRDAVIWIARLGGFLARKSDGMPGTLPLWRGWKRLSDLTHGWSLAQQATRCG